MRFIYSTDNFDKKERKKEEEANTFSLYLFSKIPIFLRFIEFIVLNVPFVNI